MAINQLSTANTFQEWLTATSALVAVANNLTDHQPGQIFAANTILDIATDGSLNVRSSASISTLYSNTANLSGVFIDTNNVSATGNGTFGGHLSVGGNVAITENVTIGGNIATAQVTSNLTVGGDTRISGNLTVSGNINLDSIGYDDLDISGSANIGNNLVVIKTSQFTGNITAGNIAVGGVMTGNANNNIYGTITAAIDSAIAFSIALG